MKGKCLCGQVEFEITGKIPNLYQCHCSLCKKATGAASCSSFVIGLDDMNWVKGEKHIRSFTKENGFRTDFCGNCGSPVPNKMNIGEYMWVPAGILEGILERKVVAHIFTKSKADWEVNSPNFKSYDGLPDSISEFMASLSNEG